MTLGPPEEQMTFPTGKARTELREAFWGVLTAGHSVRSWQSVSMIYWRLVEDELDD